ncbi:PREDICTED: F-box protein At2g27310-like [Nicotiana attenuata]|uniref:F-box protein n=1 Tax=Nicotiana attenuata TaxID=49451 RepID=A0A1J6KI86_NICAT|nr:PREDICTED: F-box protein At2g27310-like [Nicotiana attenuata]OIT19017.1 f-box protein [Nicotiana attenuata]
MSSYSTTTTTADDGRRMAITAVHSDIIQTLILTKLDGPTLISTSSASSQLKNLCSDDILWQKICNSYWPSTSNPLVQNAISTFPSGHRSLFSDSFPAILHHNTTTNICRTEYRNFSTPELISAVDIHFEENILYSKVVKTETKSGWFMASPFRVDLLGHKETVTTPVKFEGDDGICKSRLKENMKLSWILIDPKKNRAVNMSSLKPVSVRRHWLTGELNVRYSTVMASGADAGDGGGLVQCGIVVTCEGKEGGELHVREVSMQVEDIDGKVLCGKDSLVILQEAMEGRRKKGKEGEEKERYDKFLELRKLWRERKQRREKRSDMMCIVSGITIFISFWTLIVLGSRS